MSNYLDQEEGEVFNDRTDELNEVDPNQPEASPSVGALQPTRRQLAPSTGKPKPAFVQEEPEEVEETEIEADEDSMEVLSDAMLRIEQGRLYQMVMNNDLFGDVDADARAAKNVQKEIRKFAQERMEVMLGMRQENQAQVGSFPMEAFPFNTLEVEVLKSLAAAATQGASRDAEPFSNPGPQPPPKKKTFSPISKGANKTTPVKPVAKKAAPLTAKPAVPIKRAPSSAANDKIQRILQEEGLTMEEINAVFPPDYKPLDANEFFNASADDIMARNAQVGKRTHKQVQSSTAVPMPSMEHMETVYAQRAAQGAKDPLFAQIMGALEKKK